MKLLLFFAKMLPERLIRTLFISSLYSKVFKVDIVDIRVLQRINKLLMICENDYALGAGIKLSKVIWDGVELEHLELQINANNEMVLSKETEESIAIKIISRTPKWLMYNYSDMVIDIRKMIENRIQLQVA